MKLPSPLRGSARRLLNRLVERDPATARPIQVAALPWRRSTDGGIEILLVTSRRSARWLVPKGWPMRRRSLAEAAAREAFEEAGVEGTIGAREIGRFDHFKNHPVLGRLRCTVLLFPLAVKTELDTWPEQSQRGRRWFPRDAATRRVASPELARLIRGFLAEESARTGREIKGKAAA